MLSCASQQMPEVRRDVFYKKDMLLKYNAAEYVGGAILPMAPSYELHFIAKGDLNLFDFTNCHRSETSEDAWNVTTKKRTFIFKRTKDVKKEIKITYLPTAMEKSGPCPVLIAALEEEKQRHSWFFLDFEDAAHKVPATLLCDGETVVANGVSWCQSHEGLYQKIMFPKKMRISPDPQCEIGQTEGFSFEFTIKKGLCVYAFMSEDGQLHRMTTFGYESSLIRK